MKYRLVNHKTTEEHICDKVTIDGFDYYVSDNIKTGDVCPHLIAWKDNSIEICISHNGVRKSKLRYAKKVIATNNPNVNIPKVVDEFVSFEGAKDLSSFVRGYSKSQETHPNSDEDMIEFHKWAFQQVRIKESDLTTNELLQVWKEQRPKIVYYE